MSISSNKPSHLRALLRKNWILWKRSWCISCCEILIPFIFALIMGSFRQMSKPEDIPTISYYNRASTTFNYDGALNLDYFKDCDADEGGGMVAIVPDPSTNALAFDVDQALRNICIKEKF